MAAKRGWFKNVSPDVLCFGTMFILIIIGLSVLGYHWYEESNKPETKKTAKNSDFIEVDSVEWGDFVEVEYTAWVDDTSPAKVFDTTYESVAKDDSIPKTDDFNVATYGPKRIYIGEGTIPPTPDNEPYISVPTIPPGLRDGLIGMHKGDSGTIIVPQDKGYAEYQEKVLDLYQVIPRYTSISASNFTARYQLEPEVNMNVTSKDWGWPLIVVSVEGDNVTVMNDPPMGFVGHYQGWNFTLVSKNSTTLVIKHNVKAGMSVSYDNYPATVEWVDSASFKIKYNTSSHPLAGHELRYEVKIVKIMRKK